MRLSSLILDFIINTSNTNTDSRYPLRHQSSISRQQVNKIKDFVINFEIVLRFVERNSSFTTAQHFPPLKSLPQINDKFNNDVIA
jgi:hypothetical protein